MAQKTRNHGTQILLHTRHARDPATSATLATLPPHSSLTQISHNPFCTSTQPPLPPSTCIFHFFPRVPIELQIIIWKHAFKAAIGTHCFIYQVQHISDESASSLTLTRSYSIHKLSITCGNTWPPKQSTFALQTASYLSRQVAPQEL